MSDDADDFRLEADCLARQRMIEIDQRGLRVEAAEVAGWGGRTVSIPFIHQKSTTALLEKIRRL